MQNKPLSYLWALLVGLLSPVLQVLIFYFRFGNLNATSSFVDYLLFFLAGALGGYILILFWNRQASMPARWIVLVMFLLATPLALFMMIGGGLLGWLGILIFPQIPWALFTWIGSLIWKLVSRK